jgi:ribosome-associated translation inhibitor RaiA
MLVHITTDNHIHGGEHLTRDVEAAVTEALRRFTPQLQRVEVHLAADENSHKRSDKDKRCTMEARLAGMQPLAASGNGANLDQAVAGALEKLIHQLDHKLGRLGERKGRAPMGGDVAE